jgi:Na+:H+ antiporter, NhaC family
VDIIVSFFVCFILFAASVLKGIFVGYALTAGLVIFMLLALKRGYTFKNVAGMAYRGGKKSFIVLQIFTLIGAIISVWMASGTVPAVVYYGIKLLNPNLFILSAFIISSIVSFLIGTSFGTIGTAGIALMVMARGGGVNVSITAGAILSGAYFGDRCSPMSSSANLVTSLTGTNLYTNVKNMFKTSLIPLALTIAAYSAVSLRYPLGAESNILTGEIERYFKVGIIALIPATIIFLLSAFKVNVKLSMLISIIAAIIIAILFQNNSIRDVLSYIITGYRMEEQSSLKDIIKGGGILSMLKLATVVFISSAFTGIFEGTGMLKSIDKLTQKAGNRVELFLVSIMTSIAAAAFGCTQAIAVILTNMLVSKAYENQRVSKEELAVDIENTAIVIAPLIPWNIAVLVPLTTLMAGFDSIIYSFYLYLLPLVNLILLVVRHRKSEDYKPACSRAAS